MTYGQGTVVVDPGVVEEARGVRVQLGHEAPEPRPAHLPPRALEPCRPPLESAHTSTPGMMEIDMSPVPSTAHRGRGAWDAPSGAWRPAQTPQQSRARTAHPQTAPATDNSCYLDPGHQPSPSQLGVLQHHPSIRRSGPCRTARGSFPSRARASPSAHACGCTVCQARAQHSAA
jgi:hypothetical protein